MQRYVLERTRNRIHCVSRLPHVYRAILKQWPCSASRSASEPCMASLLLCFQIWPPQSCRAFSRSNRGDHLLPRARLPAGTLQNTFIGTQTPLSYHHTVSSQHSIRALRPLELLQHPFRNIIRQATSRRPSLGKTPRLRSLCRQFQHAAQQHPRNWSHRLRGQSRSRGAHSPPRCAGATI